MGEQLVRSKIKIRRKDDFLTPVQVAKMLAISTRTLRRFKNKFGIRQINAGHRTRYYVREEIYRFVEQHMPYLPISFLEMCEDEKEIGDSHRDVKYRMEIAYGCGLKAVEIKCSKSEVKQKNSTENNPFRRR